jgi:hypothetical protein
MFIIYLHTKFHITIIMICHQTPQNTTLHTDLILYLHSYLKKGQLAPPEFPNTKQKVAIMLLFHITQI